MSNTLHTSLSEIRQKTQVRQSRYPGRQHPLGFAGELGGGDLASIFQTILTGGIKDKHLPGEVRGTLTTELGEASKAFGEAFGSK